MIADYIEIPLFGGEKQQKTPVQALRRRKLTSQVVDFICVKTKFRYTAEQRNFFGLTGELNGRTAEVQRNLSGRIS
jgi:hypothetical protein